MDDPLNRTVPQGVFIEWEDGTQVHPLALTYTGEEHHPDGQVVTVWTAYVPAEAITALTAGVAHIHTARLPQGSAVHVRHEDEAPEDEHRRGDAEFMDGQDA